MLFNDTSALSEPRNLAVAAGFFLGERDDPDLGFYDSFKEGYTPPGAKELVMVLVTGMAAASLSGAVLGSFVSALVVLSRRLRINPDNITTPLAACLSDLVTLFVLAGIGSFLLPYIATPLPVAILPVLIAAGACATWFTLRNDYVKDLVRLGWTPLFAAMTISSATGVVLERCVSRYEGFAILAVAMTGRLLVLSLPHSICHRILNRLAHDVFHLLLVLPRSLGSRRFRPCLSAVDRPAFLSAARVSLRCAPDTNHFSAYHGGSSLLRRHPSTTLLSRLCRLRWLDAHGVAAGWELCLGIWIHRQFASGLLVSLTDRVLTHTALLCVSVSSTFCFF